MYKFSEYAPFSSDKTTVKQRLNGEKRKCTFSCGVFSASSFWKNTYPVSVVVCSITGVFGRTFSGIWKNLPNTRDKSAFYNDNIKYL